MEERWSGLVRTAIMASSKPPHEPSEKVCDGLPAAQVASPGTTPSASPAPAGWILDTRSAAAPSASWLIAITSGFMMVDNVAASIVRTSLPKKRGALATASEQGK